MNNQEVIFDKLKDNEVVKEILLNQDHVGNLFDMEEALVLATAFKQDHKSRLIVKKNRYEAQQCAAFCHGRKFKSSIHRIQS